MSWIFLAFIGSLCFMFFVLSVRCDYRRCRLPVVLYVQAVCVLFVLSVWRDYRRCCLTVVLHVEPIAYFFSHCYYLFAV